MAGFDLGRVIGAVLGGGTPPRRRGPTRSRSRATASNAQLGRALAGLAGIAIEALRRSQSSAPPGPAAPLPRPVPPSGKVGGGFDWAGPARPAPASPGPWGKAPGAAKPAADPWAPVAAAPEEEPSAETAEALMMLRAMIAAAKADGTIDAKERGRIAAQLDGAGLSPAARDAVLADFEKPLAPAALAKLASDPMLAAQLYAAAVVGAGEIAAAERAWLDEFAKALKLDRAAA
ncbi:MAG: DUF533 domain-containing protein, partial [Roseomonas sp.]|nr:DUF533 domain-containing protein [Roseomonas sp.]